MYRIGRRRIIKYLLVALRRRFIQPLHARWIVVALQLYGRLKRLYTPAAYRGCHRNKLRPALLYRR